MPYRRYNGFRVSFRSPGMTVPRHSRESGNPYNTQGKSDTKPKDFGGSVLFGGTLKACGFTPVGCSEPPEPWIPGLAPLARNDGGSSPGMTGKGKPARMTAYLCHSRERGNPHSPAIPPFRILPVIPIFPVIPTTSPSFPRTRESMSRIMQRSVHQAATCLRRTLQADSFLGWFSRQRIPGEWPFRGSGYSWGQTAA